MHGRFHSARIYSRSVKFRCNTRSEYVIADLSSHGHSATQTRGSACLVCALSAGEHAQLGSLHRFATDWKARDFLHEIDIKATEDKDSPAWDGHVTCGFWIGGSPGHSRESIHRMVDCKRLSITRGRFVEQFLEEFADDNRIDKVQSSCYIFF